MAIESLSRAQTTKATDKNFSFAGDKVFNSEVFQLQSENTALLKSVQVMEEQLATALEKEETREQELEEVREQNEKLEAEAEELREAPRSEVEKFDIFGRVSGNVVGLK